MFGAHLAALGEPAGTTLEHVVESADAFRMPDDAIAIKMLLFTPLACGVVCSAGGRTRWFVRNERFRTVIPSARTFRKRRSRRAFTMDAPSRGAVNRSRAARGIERTVGASSTKSLCVSRRATRF